MEERQDLWRSPDKGYHVLLCFSLTLLFSLLLSRYRCQFYRSFVRKHSLLLASFLSLLAGAAKEVADHFGFFRSSGASFKDAAADVVGVFIAAFLLSLYNYYFSHSSKSKIDETHADTATSAGQRLVALV
ncbi:hypothetical protein BVRB_9g223210 [Beta vulgaris subsp. vulgaris]|nr:hypothetical protein BVRB_9g223210 [Beta vulgaris subsp. vulgaris]